MNLISQKERSLILVSVVLYASGLLFQNCSKKFASQALIIPSTPSLIDPSVQPEEKPPGNDPNSKTLNCDIPTMRATSLIDTCLPKALERISRIGDLDNFVEYEPQFPLYSDGAEKRRWIYLPPGTRINSNDLDHWIFPKGTIVFKEFSMDGVMIETRMIEKIADGDGGAAWRFSLFANRKDETDADRIDTSNLHLQTEALLPYKASEFSDRYNIGSFDSCTKCHGRTSDMIRGFNYLQLSSASKTKNLDFIVNKGWLSKVPLRFDEIPGNTTHQQAMGYIQANCATCHDGAGPGPGDFRHLSTSVSYTDEPMYATQMARGIIAPGDAATSRLHTLFSGGGMPKIPLFNKDTEAITLIESWINQLQ